jgi:hypothetical protein
MTADPPDKRTLDLSDNDVLAEHFSRKEAGDECVFRITATLDEIGNKLAVLSVTDVTVEAYKEKTKPPKGGTPADSKDSDAMAWAQKNQPPDLSGV